MFLIHLKSHLLMNQTKLVSADVLGCIHFQESPLVHLFWSLASSHVLRSSIHWFIHSTVQEFVWNQTESTSSAGSLYGCLVHTRVRLLYSHLPKRSTPRGKRTWVWFNRTKQDRCEYTLSFTIFFFIDLTTWLQRVICL